MPSTTYEKDKELIEACIQGSPDHWMSFMEAYERVVRFTVTSCCAKYGLDGHDAEDIAGHIYEKLLEDNFRRLRLWRSESSFKTYLLQIVRRLVIDYIRKHCKGTRVGDNQDLERWLDKAALNASDAITAEQIQSLRAAIEQLPAQQALIMRMRLAGKSLRAIATLLDMPQGTVFSENARALETLRKKLCDVNGEESTPPPNQTGAL